MNRSDAATLVAMIATAYPTQTFPTATAELYEEMLLDLEYENARIAVRDRIMRNESPFIPTVAELRNAASGVPSPEEAWGLVLKEIMRTGRYRTPTFACEAVGRAVEIMGWTELCGSDNQVADRAHFFRIYETTRARSLSGVPARAALPPSTVTVLPALPPAVQVVANRPRLVRAPVTIADVLRRGAEAAIAKEPAK